MSSGIVDIIIVGGGPAGMFASFYGACAKHPSN